MAILNTGETSFPTYMRSIRWRDGAVAGLMMGTVLFFLTRGIPWVGSGAIDPAIMGREVAPGQEPSAGFFFEILGMHLFLATVYGMLIGLIVNPFRPVIAGSIGALVGLVLYFLDMAIFAAMFGQSASLSEWPSLLMHIVFGITAAEVYKGMTRRLWTAPVM
jgi:hypothetical protein